MISSTQATKSEVDSSRNKMAPDFIESKLDFKFVQVMIQRRKENMIYQIEDFNRKQIRACHVIEIIFNPEFPQEQYGNKILESHLEYFEILVQGIPVNKSDSLLSVDNVTWLGGGLDNMKAVYEVDSVYHHLDLLQCRQIWGIPPALQLNKENKMLRKNHNGLLVSTPIVPQGYFDFLLERDRRLKEIMQMFEVGSHPVFIRCHEVLEFFEQYEYYIFTVTDNLEDCTLREYLSVFKSKGVSTIKSEDSDDTKKKKLCESDQTKDLFYRLLAGLAYWHDRGKGHTDVRPENILIKQVENGFQLPKLLNFGLSKRFGEDDFYRNIDLSDPLCYPIGTVEYSPRDSRTDDNYSDIKADMFAVGVTLFEFLYGARPFKSGYGGRNRYMDSPRTKWFLTHYEEWALANFDPSLPSSDPSLHYGSIFAECTNMSVEAKNLIAKLMYPDPARRLTAREAMQHPWFDSVSRRCCDVEEETEVKTVDIVNIGFHPVVWMDGSMSFSDLKRTIPDAISSSDEKIYSELCHLDNRRVTGVSSSLLDVYINLHPYFIQNAFTLTDELNKPPTVLTSLFRTAEQHEAYMQAKNPFQI